MEFPRNSALVPRASAVLAAVLFGAATPLSKVLLGEIHPIILAGLLYLGAGLGSVLLLAVRGSVLGNESARASRRWNRSEALALTGAVAAGGIAAPIAMLYGLRATPAAVASLLLNFEVVTTALIATALFKEALGRRVWLSVGLVTAGGCILAWRPDAPWRISIGIVGILAACALWGLDNNLMRVVSANDPTTIVCVKGVGAGMFSLLLGSAVGARIPPISVSAVALVIGSLSFGASIAFYIRALRDLGAARTGALFGIAPFFGALLSMAIFPEVPKALVLASFPLMLIGAALLLAEAHRHLHTHPQLVHDHLHTHDDGHHDHAHGAGEPGTSKPHSHPHRHQELTHDHPHAPDLHHRHDHSTR